MGEDVVLSLWGAALDCQSQCLSINDAIENTEWCANASGGFGGVVPE